MMLEAGMPAAFERHATLAEATREAMKALGLDLLAPDSPSYACTAVCVPEGLDGKALVKRLRDDYGITVAGGQAKLAGKIFRIGHLGYVDGFDMLTAVGAVEMALADMGYPIKTGEGLRVASERLRGLPRKG